MFDFGVPLTILQKCEVHLHNFVLPRLTFKLVSLPKSLQFNDSTDDDSHL